MFAGANMHLYTLRLCTAKVSSDRKPDLTLTNMLVASKCMHSNCNMLPCTGKPRRMGMEFAQRGL